MDKVIKFSATWCNPCKAMAPAFEKFKEMVGEGVEVVDHDVDEYSEEASKYGVRSIPYTAFIKDDKVQKALVGVQSADSLFSAYQEIYN
jgi:thioredoxin 1